MKKFFAPILCLILLAFLSCQQNIKKSINDTEMTPKDSIHDTVVTAPQDKTQTDTSDVVRSLRERERLDSLEKAKSKKRQK
jgi:hypothetical protein